MRDYEIEIDFDDGKELEEGDDPEWAEELGPSWSVYVNVMMVPEYERIVAIQAELAEIVEPHSGEVNGWGACVE